MVRSARVILATFVLSNVAVELYGQQDSVRVLLSTLLYDKRVSPEVFFLYAGRGEYPHVLAPGTYSFIYPDSTFKKFYPDIIDALSVTWRNEKKLYTMTYLQRPEIGTVFVKSDIYSDPNLKFYLTINEIAIDGANAIVKFSTSCNCVDIQNGERINFVTSLRRKRNGWKVKKVITKRIIGCR